MRPKQQQKARHDDLFRARLDQIINLKHELVALTDRIDWAWIDDELADCFSDQGRPAEPVCFMIGMFMLKHPYALSDEQVWSAGSGPLTKTQPGLQIRPEARRPWTDQEGTTAPVRHRSRYRKTDGHLDRNFLHGRLGDQINAVMSAVGYNFRLILKWLRKILCLIIAAICSAITPFSTLKPAS